MSNIKLTIESFISWYESLRLNIHKGSTANHKPITVLFALRNILQEKRWVEYQRDREELENLIQIFSNFLKKPNCLHPLWRLKNDSSNLKVWTTLPDQMEENISGDIKVSQALQLNLKTGFTDTFYKEFSNNLGAVQYLIKEITESTFPETLHTLLYESLGIFDLEAIPSSQVVQGHKIRQPKRDPNFPKKIMSLYDNRCAFCGLKINLVNNTSISLEAAHIKWKARGGECTESNGLSLCPTHHTTFDRGLWGINSDLKIVLSSAMILDQRSDIFFTPFISKRISRHILDSSLLPSKENISWHHKYILKA